MKHDCRDLKNIDVYYIPVYDITNKYVGNNVEYRCKICDKVLKTKFDNRLFYERS
jgi:hypothetical protein